jgi:hypothetical protein
VLCPGEVVGNKKDESQSQFNCDGGIRRKDMSVKTTANRMVKGEKGQGRVEVVGHKQTLGFVAVPCRYIRSKIAIETR